MTGNEGDQLRQVVVCAPAEAYFGVRDLAAHHMLEATDPQAAVQQHERLAQVMAEAGAEIVAVPELDLHPNSTFTRDVALCTPNGYVRLRMGLPSRRGEEDWMAGVLDRLGVPCAGTIEPPGTVEGGDVILAGPVAFVGQSSRSNLAGVRQLSRLLADMGYQVRVAPVGDDHLHIGGMMSVVGPGRVLCCLGLFPPDFFRGFDVIEVPWRHPTTANVICLSHNHVVAHSGGDERAIEALEAHRVTVHRLDLSEFAKGGGGPSCLTLPVRRG